MTNRKFPHPDVYERGTGAIFPAPKDPRTYSIFNSRVRGHFEKIGVLYYLENIDALPSSVDNRDLCSPVRDQGHIGSCVSFAGVAALEYFQNLGYNTYVDMSEQYMYQKISTCGSGSHALKAMQQLKNGGVATEVCFPYHDTCPFTAIPQQCENEAPEYKSLGYVDLSAGMSNNQATVDNMRSNIASKNAITFDYAVYSNSKSNARYSGEWCYPCSNESQHSGHDMLVIGYDDNKFIANPNCSSSDTTGAFLVKNSWGTDWGLNGYGWLPYKYFLSGKADSPLTITEVTMPGGNNCPLSIQFDLT